MRASASHLGLSALLAAGCSFSTFGSGAGGGPDNGSSSTTGTDATDAEQTDEATLESDSAVGGESTGPPPLAERRRPVAVLDATGFANAPVLVTLSGSRVEYEDTLEGGADLYFVTAEGEVLPHEIERWDPAGLSHLWVRLPAAVPDIFYMVYATDEAAPEASAGRVWDDDFSAVWHFAGDTVSDATGHGHDGLPPPKSAWQTDDGRIGPGFAVDGEPIVVSDPPEYDDAITIEGWLRRDANDPSESRFLAIQTETAALRVEEPGTAQPRLRIWFVGQGTAEGGPRFTLDTAWSYVSATYDTGKIKFFVDGELAESTNVEEASLGGSTEPLRLGLRLYGTIDEVRVSHVERSNAWIAAQHRSMTDAALSFGVPEPL